ncbi:MAG: hypothetical protein AAB413_04465, partial [Patescibacteria group bacterium]
LGDGGGSAVMRVVGAEPIDPGVELSLGEGPRGENAVERIGLVGLEEVKPDQRRTPSRDPTEGPSKGLILGSLLPLSDDSEHGNALLPFVRVAKNIPIFTGVCQQLR